MPNDLIRAGGNPAFVHHWFPWSVIYPDSHNGKKQEMITDVNKVISELYGALVGFPGNEEDRSQKIISNWKDIRIDNTLHDLLYLLPSLVKFEEYLKKEQEIRKGNATPPTE